MLDSLPRWLCAALCAALLSVPARAESFVFRSDPQESVFELHVSSGYVYTLGRSYSEYTDNNLTFSNLGSIQSPELTLTFLGSTFFIRLANRFSIGDLTQDGSIEGTIINVLTARSAEPANLMMYHVDVLLGHSYSIAQTSRLSWLYSIGTGLSYQISWEKLTNPYPHIGQRSVTRTVTEYTTENRRAYLPLSLSVGLNYAFFGTAVSYTYLHLLSGYNFRPYYADALVSDLIAYDAYLPRETSYYQGLGSGHQMGMEIWFQMGRWARLSLRGFFNLESIGASESATSIFQVASQTDPQTLQPREFNVLYFPENLTREVGFAASLHFTYAWRGYE